MSKTSSTQNNGIGFSGLLIIAFITLKLLGKIDWSWWWVFSPIWITLGAGIFLVIGTLFLAAINVSIKANLDETERLREEIEKHKKALSRKE